MARAKRTERAEARRRYRAATASDPEFDETESPDTAANAGSTRRPSAAAASRLPTSGTTERVGFLDAFRQSIRPVHVREDVAALPWIATHSRALWVPILITVVSTIATAATGAKDMVTGLLFTYFVVFPAIGGVFIAGFLAPRASWLVGVVVGLVSAICYVALGLTNLLPAPFSEQFQTSAASATIAAFVYSPIMGAFFAAAAAWYRRFLALSSPNRNRRQAQGQKARPGDGRTRGASTSQKAAAKR
ncbi:MAG: hypothetical protein ABI562_05500 [Chloroflexota bacterium]